MNAKDFSDLCGDLVAESEELTSLLADLEEAAWERSTPAEGWTVRDQITHLAYFDEVTTTAVLDPEAFQTIRDHALVDLDAYVERSLDAGRGLRGPQMLAWWTEARGSLVTAFQQAGPTARVPWFGPPMSIGSKASARLMETWAHGQDVVDALGLDREPTRRIRHVAHLGVRTFANSFRARGLEVPDVAPRVELLAPDGDLWAWGPEDADDRVEGTATDFCLVVTQRRHPDDTQLRAAGDTARRWMGLAQAFAGPPGAGRRPGQFAGTELPRASA